MFDWFGRIWDSVTNRICRHVSTPVNLRKYKQFLDLCNSEQALAGLFHIH